MVNTSTCWEDVLCAQLCLTLWDPMDGSPPGSLSTEFFRQEYWSELPFPPPEDLPGSGIETVSPPSPALQEGSLPLSHLAPGPSQVALVVKNLPATAGDVRTVSSIPGSERSPGGEHGNPLQYPCLESPMDRGAWQATVRRVTKSWI